MTNPYLLLWFEAPLQAWGYDSRFGRRDTLGFPTKSGVLGLLCCALGAGGPQRVLLADFAELDMQIMAFVRADRNGKPVPREPLMRDFHMVGSGYNDQNPWQNLLIPKTNKGKKAVGGGTKLTYRFYLQDMAFGVALQVPKAQRQILVDHLQDPVWDLYLGRKSCVPTEFIYQGIFSNAQKAFETCRNLAQGKNRVAIFKVLQGEHEGEVFTLNDVPVQFGQDKQYRDRRVTFQSWVE